MSEAMPSHPEPPADRPMANEPSPARRAQFLATEHWSLLATRSLSWNESFARTSMFLTTLSTATVALALVGSATGFGPEFVAFALVVLSTTLFIGVATWVRLVQVNNEDVYWVAGMNRLRGQYAKLEPGIEDEFVTGTTLDTAGFAQTFAALDATSYSVLHAFITTPGMVAVVDAVLAGVIAGLVTLQAAPVMSSALLVGLVVSIAAVVLFLVYSRRQWDGYSARMIRFQERPK